MKTNAADELALTRGHYAALRAHLQGVPAAAIAGLYLGHGAGGEELPEVRLVVRELLEVRGALIQRAHQHGQPELALALQRDVRGSNSGMDRAVDAVRRLEQLGTPRPAMQHSVELWFAPVLAKRLRAAGLGSVGEVVNCCNARGRGWWRRIPRVGALAAGAIVSWLRSHEKTLGVALGAHVTGDPAALSLPEARQPVTTGAGAPRLAPIEALRVVQHLDGSNGRNRGARERCTLLADNDYDAILSWLSLGRRIAHLARVPQGGREVSVVGDRRARTGPKFAESRGLRRISRLPGRSAAGGALVRADGRALFPGVAAVPGAAVAGEPEACARDPEEFVRMADAPALPRQQSVGRRARSGADR